MQMMSLGLSDKERTALLVSGLRTRIVTEGR